VLAGGALAFGRGRVSAQASADEITLLSAARIGDDDKGVVLDGEGVSPFPLPARGHGLVKVSNGRVMLVGRRPGKFAAIVDPQAPQQASIVPPIRGHRFAGHAAISGEGLLATSEIEEETGDGVVVMRDSATGSAREVFMVGIEPHDLLFAGDGRL